MFSLSSSGVRLLFCEENIKINAGIKKIWLKNIIRKHIPEPPGLCDKIMTLDSSGHSSLLSYQVPQVQNIINTIFSKKIPDTIIDCTCHIGGDSINFSNMFPECKITCIDPDKRAIECIEENIKNFSPNFFNFKIVNDDCVTWIAKNKPKADLYYIDPPWPKNYYNLFNVRLYINDKPVESFINYILINKLTENIILKTPRNFAYGDLKRRVKGKTELYFVRKLQKNGSVAYGLISIVPG